MNVCSESSHWVIYEPNTCCENRHSYRVFTVNHAKSRAKRFPTQVNIMIPNRAKHRQHTKGGGHTFRFRRWTGIQRCPIATGLRSTLHTRWIFIHLHDLHDVMRWMALVKLWWPKSIWAQYGWIMLYGYMFIYGFGAGSYMGFGLVHIWMMLLTPVTLKDSSQSRHSNVINSFSQGCSGNVGGPVY